MQELYLKKLNSILGEITLISSNRGIHRLLWQDEQEEIKKYSQTIRTKSSSEILRNTETQLKEYFSGSRKIFDLPLDISGTFFQRRVWKQISQIGFGETLSYGELAHLLGDVHKARAVGGALGKNPVPILVACHRVIAAKGQIGGFSGGLKVKRFLLDFEKYQN